MPCWPRWIRSKTWWRPRRANSAAVDILVNNAATNISFGPCLEIDEGQFDKMVEINLKSAFRLIKAVAPGMCERGSGSIVNIASIAGLRPQLHSLLYSMTKAALIMMTQSYALELGPKGVRVNAIAPGLIQTTLSEYYWKDETHARRASWPISPSSASGSHPTSRRLRCCWPATEAPTLPGRLSPSMAASCFPDFDPGYVKQAA